MKIFNKAKSYLQSWFLLIISFVIIGCLLVIALENRTSSESLTLIQTLLAIIVLVPVILSLPELKETLRKYNAKPDFKILIKGTSNLQQSNRPNRDMIESIPDEGFNGQKEFEVTFDVDEVISLPQQPLSKMVLAIRNIGNGTLHAPVIRLMPLEGSESLLELDKGTRFTKEIEGYVLYNPIGHIMSKDTVVYGMKYTWKMGNRNTEVKYKLTIRGADQEEIWSFIFTMKVIGK